MLETDLTLWIPSRRKWIPGRSKAIPIFFREIPEGSFQMGSRVGHFDREEPVHTVKISKFYMGVFPVTQEQWRAVVEACKQQGLLDREFDPSPSLFEEGDQAHRRPVENVSWDDVKQWLAGANELLKRKDRIKVEWHCTGEREPFVLLLPTEAEWEYACRAGTETEYYTGDGEAALAEAGWYGENSGNTTHPVGEKKPNEWGLYDMHGNVWEWCEDAWDVDAYKKRPSGLRNPLVTAPMVGEDEDEDEDDAVRVVRGGSWFNLPVCCRSAYRGGWGPVIRFRDPGFRVCLRSDPSPSRTDSHAAAGAASEGDAAERSDGRRSTDDGKQAADAWDENPLKDARFPDFE